MVLDQIKEILKDTMDIDESKITLDAKLNGIDNYTGSQRQNDELLRLLKEGKLRT